MLKLRPYQNAGVDELRAALNEHSAPLYVCPTGGGKTVVFTYIAHGASLRGRRVFILAHREELIEQTSKALLKFDVHHALIVADCKPNPTAMVQVCSIQTLVRRLHKWPAQYGPDIFIVDEAHHATSGSYREVLRHFPNAKIIGVTATPVRTDGQGLGIASGGIFDTMIMGPQVTELIRQNYLVAPAVYAPGATLDFNNLRKKDLVGGDISKKVAAEKVDKRSVTGDAVEHYARLAHGSPCAVFCISIAHAKHVAEQFGAAGYRAFHISGKTDKSERKRILKGLSIKDASGRYLTEIVCSCDVISEGTDIPTLGCGIMLRPTLSLALFIQQAGRIMRPCEGKERGVLLDHVGNVARHGMPDEPREWSLDGAPPKRGTLGAAPATSYDLCPKCFAYALPTHTCEQCGYVWPIDAAEVIETAKPGELIEIGLTEREQLAAAKRAEIAAADTLDKLERLARRKGWPPTWAKHTYNQRVAMHTRPIHFKEYAI